MDDLFYENYLNYNRDIRIAVGLDIDINVNPSPVPPTPVDPKGNEIWYRGEYYDLENTINILSQQIPYVGPAILSNELVGDKYVITFDSPVTKIGAEIESGELYPVFIDYSEIGLTCNITGIEIPNSVTIIGNNAFYKCASLTSITVPNSVTSIGDMAFYNAGLTSIIIPDSVTSIGNSAFEDCSSLSSVTISDSVTSIGDGAFQSCSSLSSVTISDSVTSIGDGAFYGCTSLSFIMCDAITPAIIGVEVFDNTNNCPIYVPTQSVAAYKTAWSEYADRIVGVLNNNQIKYTANEQLTIQSGVDYSDHIFDNGVGLVTFTNNLTTLDNEWFRNTFDNYEDNITSLTLPNGVSSIGMSALSSANTVYYEGTQKECARINRSWFDGSGVNEYHCFDGIVADGYQSNRINSLLLYGADWLKNLIGEETLNYLITTISSAKIDKHPMTAEEFITMLVNGTTLSTYGFTVVTQEVGGVTTPLAQHTESGHLIAIAKANDYAYVDLAHIALVTVNESLDPDYMYVLFDDTAIGPEPEPMVNVIIEHEGGTSETVTLYDNQTYADQGYGGYYSQNTYDSGMGEMPEQFSVDDTYPADGVTIYDYCNDTYEPEEPPVDPEEPEEPTDPTEDEPTEEPQEI